MEIVTLHITDALDGHRLDKALAQLAPQYSRARLQGLIDAGQLSRDGKVVTQASLKVSAGQVYVLTVPEAAAAEPVAQAIALDIVYEDKDLLVINKSADMVVHPAAGNEDGTLVNALLAHCGDQLSGIGGVKRPGIVHRLDKETAGLMVVAKNDAAHHGLSEQLSSRTLRRVYQAIVWGIVSPAEGRIEGNIGRSPTNRKKMAVLPAGGKEAVTDYSLIRNYSIVASHIECRLHTGRTHQIRVHMAHQGYPLVGDPLYGKKGAAKFLRLNKIPDDVALALLQFPRQALYAAQLEFIHPISHNKMSFKAPVPADMQALLASLKKIGSGK